jgi:predicted O-methyltransferase YrrM
VTAAHFWQELEGYFTFPDFYTWLAEQMPTDRSSEIVEVGVFGGQSLAYLGVELQRLGKGLCRVHGVDLFHGGVDNVRRALSRLGDTLGVLWVGDSAKTAENYPDESLDAVFIDADHEYEAVARDIDAWAPKVRPGGTLAGHDFTPHFPGVVAAVTERFAHWRVWRGIKHGGDEAMQGHYWPVWSVQR